MVAATAFETAAEDPAQQDAGVEPSVALLSTVADPYRYALIAALVGGTIRVCDLQAQIPIPANLMSYHLRVLREAGLVVGARRGRWVDYRLAPDALDRLHAALPAYFLPGDASLSPA